MIRAGRSLSGCGLNVCVTVFVVCVVLVVSIKEFRAALIVLQAECMQDDGSFGAWLRRSRKWSIPPDASRPLAFGRRVPQALTASHLWVRRVVGKAWALPSPRLRPSASRLGCRRSRNGAQYSTVRWPSPRRALLPDLPITLYDPNSSAL